MTPEDQGELRALERFIGRGIVRKKAEGFNYSPPRRHPASRRKRTGASAGRSQGSPAGRASQDDPGNLAPDPRAVPGNAAAGGDRRRLASRAGGVSRLLINRKNAA